MTYQCRYTHTGIPSDEEYQTYQRLSDPRTDTTQSTPSPTTPSSLYELPTTYPLITPTFPITHMPTQQITIPPDFPFFSGNAGDSHTAQPLQWLRRYENIFPAGTKDTDVILIFDRVLDPESPAEEWYEEFTTAKGVPTTWNDLKQEFKDRWSQPNMEVPKRTKQQLLLSVILAEDDVGKIITEGQRKDEAHLIR